MTELTDTERETLQEIEARHTTAPDWNCKCGYDCFGGTAAYSLELFRAHFVDVMCAAVEAILTARLARIEALRVSMADGRSLTNDARYWRAKFADMLAAALAAPTPDEVQQP